MPKAPRTSVLKPARNPTTFETRLYDLCKCIPAGRVATYGLLAQLLKSAPRAVGQGLRRNPFAPVVPCHRVVSSDLGLGGFNGGWGDSNCEVLRKKQLLLAEGVGFEDNCVAKACVLTLNELRDLIPGSIRVAVLKDGTARKQCSVDLPVQVSFLEAAN